MTKIKIRERYAIAPYNSGNAVAVIKNVKAIPNKLVVNPVSTILSSGITKINRASKVLNADGSEAQ